MVCFLSEPGEHHDLYGGIVSINFIGMTGLQAHSHCAATGNTIIHPDIKVDWI